MGRLPVCHVADTDAVPEIATTPDTDAETVVATFAEYDGVTVRVRVARSEMLLLDHSPPAVFENGVDPDAEIDPDIDQSAPDVW